MVEEQLVVAQMSCASSAATSRQHDVSSATRSLDALNPAPASRHGAGANGGSLATVSFPSALTALALHPADANVFVVRAYNPLHPTPPPSTLHPILS